MNLFRDFHYKRLACAKNKAMPVFSRDMVVIDEQ
jgi:hypothetical protein